MTEQFIKKHCRENKLYQTPWLNDVLYLHYKGKYNGNKFECEFFFNYFYSHVRLLLYRKSGKVYGFEDTLVGEQRNS